MECVVLLGKVGAIGVNSGVLSFHLWEVFFWRDV